MTGSESFSHNYLREVADIATALDARAVDEMANALAALRSRNGRLFLLGVGGSAANASHAAGDFRKLAHIEAYAATDNATEVTARTNDQGWDQVFVEYLKASRLTPRDGVLIFSVGGGSINPSVSANLVHAMSYARALGTTIFAVVGRDGGAAAQLANHAVLIPVVNAVTITPHSEAFQAVVWHLLVSHPVLAAATPHWETVQPMKVSP